MTARFPRVQRFFPLPLVAVAALLAILILITPNLTTPAGSLATQAELLVDGVSGSNTTDLYVRGLSTVRYTSIQLGVEDLQNWSHIPPVSNLSFKRVVNATNSLGSNFVSTWTPLAVNVTAIYRDSSGSCVSYSAIYAIDFAPPNLLTADLSGGGGFSSTSLSNLPLILLLNSAPLGAC